MHLVNKLVRQKFFCQNLASLLFRRICLLDRFDAVFRTDTLFTTHIFKVIVRPFLYFDRSTLHGTLYFGSRNSASVLRPFPKSGVVTKYMWK